jgi:hypothetical protein
VRRPNGTIVCGASAAVERTCQLDAAGTHEIRVRDLNGPDTGNYRIAVQRLNNPTGCTALTFGAAPTTGNIATAGEMDCFTFTGANLDDIRIRIIKNAPADPLLPRAEVVRPDGSTICGASTAVNRTCVLDAAGSHRIIVRDGTGGGTATGAYRLQIQRLNDPGSCPAISPGAAPTSAAIATSPEMDCFTYDAATASQALRVRLVETSGSLSAATEIVRPDGTTICGPNTAIDRTCNLGATGNYRILVRDDNGPDTGNYRIAVQRLNNPVGCTAISLGATGSTGEIATSAEMDCYTYNAATASQKIRVRAAETSGSLSATIEVVRPDGKTICAANTAIEINCNLGATGTYRIIVRDFNGPNTGTYGISLRRLNGTASCEVLTPGSSVIEEITVASEQDCYAFTGNSGDTILVEFSAFGDTFTASIEWIRPNGTTVCGPVADDDAAANSCTLDTTGTHQIIIRDHSAAGTGTGSYFLSAS